ncbi:MAG: RagB/SusD family nutrient uptake outer membrane protein, partial [Tannerellaceae bacterium]|nr:RagB/SusD family nutrient uptake outer membrane protein [Tannerellaceae bacterium]
MKKIYQLILIIGFTGILSSCFGDLDTFPLDSNEMVTENVYSDPAKYKGILAKCYASLILTGQQGGDGGGNVAGGNDLGSFNEGYGGYVRVLFYLQSLTTDETLMPSSTNGLRDCATDSWNPTTAVLQGCYNRLYHTIGYCNNFIAETTPEKLQQRGVQNDPEIVNNLPFYLAEARLIRAYAYHMLCDLFGAVPFADENTEVWSKPEQKTRLEIFKFVEDELLDVVGKLKDPHENEYARVDKAAAWFLLARHYLNAEVFTGTARYAEAYTYAKKVIDANYRLAAEHRFNFMADNNTSPEIIWPLVQDGINAQSSAGTNFFVKAFMNGDMNNFFETGIGKKGWGNVRILPELVDKFDPADQLFDIKDPWGLNKMDKRVQFFTENGHTKYPVTESGDFGTDFKQGYGFIKWRNVRSDGLPANDETYVDIDFPLFRSADAYLMAAEAIMRAEGSAGTMNEALEYVNEVRARAYQSGKYGSGNAGIIQLNDLTFDFLLDERARELCTELTRRTDLIRFGKFTKGYNWYWKGYVATGQDIDDKYILF